MDLRRQFRKKQRRFRRPEFQEQLKTRRDFTRKENPIPERFWPKVLYFFGFRSRATRFLLLLFIVIVIYFLTLSNVFVVTQALVESETSVPVGVFSEVLEEMKGDRFYLLPKNHFLIFNETRYLRALQNRTSDIRRLTKFKKIFPNKVELSVEERSATFIYQTGDDYYFLDQDGVVFQKLANYDPARDPQPLVTDQTEQPISIGEDLRIADSLGFIRALTNSWPDQGLPLDYSIFLLPARESPDIFVKTDIGFEIFFDATRPYQSQLTHLQTVLNREIDPATYSGLAYIDLRLPTVAYYCYQDAECNPENQLVEEEGSIIEEESN